jgi:hypothetical protein
MTYPVATQEHADFFREHGFLVVRDAIACKELDILKTRFEELLVRKAELANDWAWEKGKPRTKRSFTIVQANPTRLFPDIAGMQFRRWATSFATHLMGQTAGFWYDQYIGKPPRDGAETYWHQDEGYWGRDLDNKGLTCWMPLQSVDTSNGCMHFIDRGHLDGILPHTRPPHIQSDLLFCEPDITRAIVCAIERGDVTFHHSKTPHKTTANTSDQWRHAITTHMSVQGIQRGGGHYPWHVVVNQQPQVTVR